MNAYYSAFIILLLVCSSGITSGQNTTSNFSSEIDSLWELITAQSSDSKNKVQLLNDYARLCFYGNRIKEGFIAAKEARDISDQLNFEGGRVMYYLTLAAYHGNGDDDMFIYYENLAQSLSRSMGDLQMNYYVDLEIPELDYGNDYEARIAEFSSILEYFKDPEDKEIQANLLMALAFFNQALQNYEEVITIQDQIIQLFTELNQVYPVFLFSSYKMNTLKNIGREKEAKKIELELIELFAKNENENAVGPIAYAIASRYAESGRYLLAVEYYLKSVDLFERIEDYHMVARAYFNLAVAYENLNLNREAYESYLYAIPNLRRVQDTLNLINAYGALVFPTISIGKYDEARKYMAIALRDTLHRNKYFLLGRFNDANGQILKRQGKFLEAIPFFEKARKDFDQSSISWTAPFMPLYLTECYYNIGKYETALQYGLKCLDLEKTFNLNNTLVKKRASLWLSKIYEELGDLGNAYAYLKMHQEITEESEKLDELNRIADAEVKEILDKSRKEIDALEREQLESIQQNRMQRLWIFSITGALLSALVILLVLFRNNKNKQKANKLLLTQKEEIQATLEKLESTQTQLIHSEKMASLGELTAGIAHEIQNPLNFVNNFSEVSSELIEEVKKEMKEGDMREAREILNDLQGNLSKITHHGQRASGIVRSMLDHSRTSTGEKVPSDINALCDEYLRLAYHGMRARDRSFNSDFELDLDPSLPTLEVIPQDIGRVLLNLINNAFQATNNPEIIGRADRSIRTGQGSKVLVTTKHLGDKINIAVSDNGPGIPEEIKDKIFHPFFTTKPTGQGTGLGLSLSYDIIKAHGGTIDVNTQKGEGTTFLIRLPLDNH